MGTFPPGLYQVGKDLDAEAMHIKPSFRDLIEPLHPDELQQLAQNIQEHGCLDPILVTSELWIIDGHNRYEICRRHAIPFQVRVLEFVSEDAIKDYMIDNQLGRRNLNEEQVRYYRGLKYNHSKKRIGYNPTKDKGDTAEKLAKEYKTSKRTISRNEDYYLGINAIDQHNPLLKKQILLKEVAIPSRDIELLGKQENLSKHRQLIEMGQLDKVIERIKRERDRELKRRKPALARRREELAKLTDTQLEAQRIAQAQATLSELEPVFLTREQQLKKLRAGIASNVRAAVEGTQSVNEKVVLLREAIAKIQKMELLLQGSLPS